MKILVKFTAQLKKEAGVSTREFDIVDNEPFRDFITRISKSFNENFRDMVLDKDGEFKNTIMLVHNGTQVSINEPVELQNGDEIMLLSPIAGG